MRALAGKDAAAYKAMYMGGTFPPPTAIRSGMSNGLLPVESLRGPTSFFCLTDAVVPWKSCVEREGSTAESIEVTSSDLVLGVSHFVLYAIGDRLAQLETGWRPFKVRRLDCLVYWRTDPDDTRGGQ